MHTSQYRGESTVVESRLALEVYVACSLAGRNNSLLASFIGSLGKAS